MLRSCKLCMLALAALLLMGSAWTSASECSKGGGQNLEKAGKQLSAKADRLKSYNNLNGAVNVASASARKYRVAAKCYARSGACKKAATAAISSEKAAQKAQKIADSAPSYYRGVGYAAKRAKKLSKAARKSAEGYGCGDK